jgi:cytochrome P450
MGIASVVVWGVIDLLPGIVISEQLGLAPDQIGTFRRRANAVLAPAQGLLIDENTTLRYADIEAEAQHYLADVFEDRRARPTTDLISAASLLTGR